MDIKRLRELFEEKHARELRWAGKCVDCGEQTTVVAKIRLEDGAIVVSGGGVIEWDAKYPVKCDKCVAENRVFSNFQPTEVFSRVCGYLRPTTQWNIGKQAEFVERKYFKVE